ncbi:hypothetical protein MNV49_004901 [Pseudohyphozyma bogoriensis]|nr:hypothetical protein MNV49_004901 [Pseudohyphozyma bogoriensis]
MSAPSPTDLLRLEVTPDSGFGRLANTILDSYLLPDDSRAAPPTLLLHTAEACCDSESGALAADLEHAKKTIKDRLMSPADDFTIIFCKLSSRTAWGETLVKPPSSRMHTLRLTPLLIDGFSGACLVLISCPVKTGRMEPRTRHVHGRVLDSLLLFSRSKKGHAALEFICQVVLTHGWAHVFRGLVTGKTTPESVKACGYQDDGGEWDTRFEELHLGGHLGVLFRGQGVKWGACCGMTLKVWDDKKGDLVTRIIDSKKLQALPPRFPCLTPDSMANFLRDPDSPEVRTMRRFINAGDVVEHSVGYGVVEGGMGVGALTALIES